MSKETKNEIEKVNSWAHHNPDAFREVIQVSGHKHRIQCPFHNSKDFDMGYNMRTGLWKCFGSCDKVFGDSTTVITLLRENISPEEWHKKSVKSKFFLKCKTARSILKENETGTYEPINYDKDANDVFRRSEESDSPWELNFPGIAILYREKFMPEKSAGDAVRNFFETFKLNESWTRFKKETMKKFKVFEPTKKSPLFLQNFNIYMLSDETGRPISFQGRRKEDIELPDFMKNIKMYNLPNTPVEKIVYGLSLIRNGKTHHLKKVGDHYKAKAIIIHEGQGDVLRSYENNLTSVSFLGKEASEYQITKTLKYLIEGGEIIIFFDNDEPGRKASIKVAKKFLKKDPKLNISIAFLEEKDKDPGDSAEQEMLIALKKRKKVVVKKQKEA